MGPVPLTAQQAVGRLPGLKEPELITGPDATVWLIWLEHVIFFPGVYAMSLLGIAFGAYMFHKHAPAAPETARAAG